MGEVTIIAEIGTSHGGDFGKALTLMEAAKLAGADVVKFQAVYADEIIHPNAGEVPLPGGSIKLYDKFKSLEREAEFYRDLKEAARSIGVHFLCTPFGLKSAEMLRDMGVDAYKVASPELNHLPLLDFLASTGARLFLSLGVSLISDIEDALAAIGGRSPVTLLHCVTAYPAPEEDYNLRLLPALAALFGVRMGVSDHSFDPILIPTLAVTMGAVVVEKHICLSEEDGGLDDPIALNPDKFALMCSSIRTATDDKQYLLYLKEKYGRERVEAALGDGHKRLAPSEMANYGRTNRSICAVDNIKKGEVFTETNTALYRVEKILLPGLKPKFWPIILGRAATRAISAGNGVSWSDVGAPTKGRSGRLVN